MPNLIQDVIKSYMVAANTMESLLIFRNIVALNAGDMSYSSHSIVLGPAVTTVAGAKSGLKRGMFLTFKQRALLCLNRYTQSWNMLLKS